MRRFDRETAHGVLRSSFAQWQAQRTPDRHNEMLTEALGRRLAVFEELGYVHGWSLTDAGRRLSTVYHESDLLVAEALSGGRPRRRRARHRRRSPVRGRLREASGPQGVRPRPGRDATAGPSDPSGQATGWASGVAEDWRSASGAWPSISSASGP